MVEAQCLWCHRKREVWKPVKVQVASPRGNGKRWMIKGTCPACGKNISKLSSEAEQI